MAQIALDQRETEFVEGIANDVVRTQDQETTPRGGSIDSSPSSGSSAAAWTCRPTRWEWTWTGPARRSCATPTRSSAGLGRRSGGRAVW